MKVPKHRPLATVLIVFVLFLGLSRPVEAAGLGRVHPLPWVAGVLYAFEGFFDPLFAPHHAAPAPAQSPPTAHHAPSTPPQLTLPIPAAAVVQGSPPRASDPAPTNTLIFNPFAGLMLTSRYGDIHPADGLAPALGTSVHPYSQLNMTNASIDSAGSLSLSGSLTITGFRSGVVHSDAHGQFSSSAVDLGGDVTNTLSVGNGGTGVSSLTPNGLLYGNGGNGIAAVTPGTLGYILQSNGADATPTWVAPGGLSISHLPFSGVTGSTNTTAAMVVGTGASLDFSGSGTVNASSLIGGTWASPGVIGSTTPNVATFSTLTANGNETIGGTTGMTLTGIGAGISFGGAGNHAISAALGTLQMGAVTLTGAITGNTQSITGLGTVSLATGNSYQINGASVVNATTLGSSVVNSSLTSLGTITTGTWNGAPVGTAYGGTGTGTAFTPGAVVFAGASGAYAQDSATFSWDSTNHRLGLGTTAPLTTLDIAGTASLSGSLSYRGAGTAHTTSILDGGTYNIQRSPGGNSLVSSLFIDASGNVGIGTTAPGFKLHVVGTTGSANVRVEGTGGPRFSFNAIDGGTDQKKWQNYATTSGLNFSALNDAANAETFWLQVARGTGTAISSVSFPTGNIGIGTTSPTLGPLQMASGAYVTSGGVWTNASDRNLKTNFTPLDPQTVLSKIDALSVPQWNYKSEDAGIKHIGPVAQDFYSIFGVGNTNTSISTIDPAGIALIGIQALDQKYSQLTQGITVGVSQPASVTVSAQSVTSLQESMQSLADRVTALEKQVPMQVSPISASLSAALTGVTLSLDKDATISGSLIVQGRTTLNGLGVTGNITAGVLSINGLDGTIDAIGNTLKLQSLGTGSIDLLAGKVTVDESGNIVAKGDITAKKINIDESDPASASSGNGILKAGSTAVTIKTTAVHARSHFFVTPRVKTTRVLGVSAESDSVSFTIEVVDAPTTDIPFDWWIVN